TEPPDAAAAADSMQVKADSVTAALQARQQQVLEEIDTVGMPAPARAALRAAMAEIEAGLQAAADNTARQPGVDAMNDARGSDRAAGRDSATAQDGAAQDTTVAADSPIAMSADTALPPGTLQPWAREIRIEGASPLFRPALERKLAQVGHLPVRDAIRAVLRDLLEYAPHMVFLLLPLFALMLKLLYIRRSRYYAEHFVFALHVHAFVFVMFTVMFILPWDWLNGMLVLWIVVYVWLALQRVYRQGWFRTTVKWSTLGWTYAWFLLFGVVGLGVVTLLFT
ncbi:MAG: hypothetical protein ACREK1_04290, partial [Longimicrobiales bacterium]